MAADDLVRYRREGRVAYLTLNRPDKLNAFTDDGVRALRARLAQFDTDDDAWVAVLHGAGRAFCSGADVRQRQLRDPAELRSMTSTSGAAPTNDLLYAGLVNWKPIIAAPHGYAFGLGLGLSLRCELIVADAETRFQATETSRGLYGGHYWAIMQFRGAGTFADEVFMTGRSFGAREAAANGVVTEAVEDGRYLEVAGAYAERIAANPPLGVRALVRARRWQLQRHEADHGLVAEGWKLHLTEDFRESALAFAEKRPPRPFRAR
jgi:enoyl-CoA hydratase/carnithine racemase